MCVCKDGCVRACVVVGVCVFLCWIEVGAELCWFSTPLFPSFFSPRCALVSTSPVLTTVDVWLFVWPLGVAGIVYSSCVVVYVQYGEFVEYAEPPP